MTLPSVAEEQQLLADVIELAEKYGILYFHDYDSTRNPRGYPDLTLVGIKSVMFVELKSQTGKLRREQVVWKWRLMATGTHYALWRPADLENGHIESVLENL